MQRLKSSPDSLSGINKNEDVVPLTRGFELWNQNQQLATHVSNLNRALSSSKDLYSSAAALGVGPSRPADDHSPTRSAFMMSSGSRKRQRRDQLSGLREPSEEGLPSHAVQDLLQEPWIRLPNSCEEHLGSCCKAPRRQQQQVASGVEEEMFRKGREIITRALHPSPALVYLLQPLTLR
ncbi:hypothetical protein SESBI_23252 [Sesbania bispinosa]|nr:hypothetical protein SESBI_23252 [Sesbania bispinosa]